MQMKYALRLLCSLWRDSWSGLDFEITIIDGMYFLVKRVLCLCSTCEDHETVRHPAFRVNTLNTSKLLKIGLYFPFSWNFDAGFWRQSLNSNAFRLRNQFTITGCRHLCYISFEPTWKKKESGK